MMIFQRWSFSMVLHFTWFFCISNKKKIYDTFYSLTFNIALNQPLVKLRLSWNEISSTHSVSRSNQCFNISDFSWNIFLSFTHLWPPEPFFYIRSQPPAHIKFLLKLWFYSFFDFRYFVLSHLDDFKVLKKRFKK